MATEFLHSFDILAVGLQQGSKCKLQAFSCVNVPDAILVGRFLVIAEERPAEQPPWLPSRSNGDQQMNAHCA
jgi:hypothetical protein